MILSAWIHKVGQLEVGLPTVYLINMLCVCLLDWLNLLQLIVTGPHKWGEKKKITTDVLIYFVLALLVNKCSKPFQYNILNDKMLSAHMACYYLLHVIWDLNMHHIFNRYNIFFNT